MNETDVVKIRQLNQTYRRYFYDVKIPQGEEVEVPYNPVTKMLISTDIFFHRYIHGYLHMDRTLFQFQEPQRTRNNSELNIVIKPARKDVKRNSFIYKKGIIWNSWPTKVQNCEKLLEEESKKRIVQKFNFLEKSKHDIEQRMLSNHSRDVTRKIKAHRRSY